MAEQYLTKVDLLEHEKDANKRREDTKKDEQRLRHEQTERFQKVINKIDDKINITHDKVESNDKELDLLKQSHSTMTEKVNEIKSEMKEGFSSIENKMEDFLKTMKEGYSSKAESEALDIRIGKLEKGVLRLISLVAAGVVGAILKLILIG